VGINANMRGRWIKENESDDGQALRGNGKLIPEPEEMRRLKESNKRLNMEQAI
jgi:transposase